MASAKLKNEKLSKSPSHPSIDSSNHENLFGQMTDFGWVFKSLLSKDVGALAFGILGHPVLD